MDWYEHGIIHAEISKLQLKQVLRFFQSERRDCVVNTKAGRAYLRPLLIPFLIAYSCAPPPHWQAPNTM